LVAKTLVDALQCRALPEPIRESLEFCLAEVRAAPEPGSWTLDRGQVRNAAGWVVASAPYTTGGHQDRSTGRLIAMAPELLEVLERLLELPHIDAGAWANAHRVVDAVKGET